jgi:predicted nuclease of predicted toxin-antitoxin system
MALKLYMDHHVPRAITSALRARQIDALTAYEDAASTIADPLLLDRATALDRVLFTRDDDLLAEATKRQQNGQYFKGVIPIQCTHSACHAERSEASRLAAAETLRFAQGDSMRKSYVELVSSMHTSAAFRLGSVFKIWNLLLQQD